MDNIQKIAIFWHFGSCSRSLHVVDFQKIAKKWTISKDHCLTLRQHAEPVTTYYLLLTTYYLLLTTYSVGNAPDCTFVCALSTTGYVGQQVQTTPLQCTCTVQHSLYCQECDPNCRRDPAYATLVQQPTAAQTELDSVLALCD